MSLLDCPFCMSPLDGEESQCPNCGSDLSEYRDEPTAAAVPAEPVAEPPAPVPPESPEPLAEPGPPEPSRPNPTLDRTADPVTVREQDSLDELTAEPFQREEPGCADRPGAAADEDHRPPIEVRHANLRYKKGDAGCITLSVCNTAGEVLDLVECSMDSRLVPLLDTRRGIHVLYPRDEVEEHFSFRDDAPGGRLPLTARFKCMTRDHKARFYLTRFTILVESPDPQQGAGPQVIHYHNEKKIKGKYVIARDSGENHWPGNHVNGQDAPVPAAEPEWIGLRLRPDDRAAREAAEEAAARSSVRVVEVTAQREVVGRQDSADRPGPIDLATLSRRLPSCREVVTLCSRPEFIFGADRGGREGDVVIWPPPVTPNSEHNWRLYRAVSRRHGELRIGFDEISLLPTPECKNGMRIDGQLIQPPHTSPVPIRGRATIEFPHSGIVYRARVLRPRAETRQNRLASLVTLDVHATRALGPGGAAHPGLLGMEGFADIDAVRLAPRPNSLQQAEPDVIETFVVLVREALIGSGPDNAVVVAGSGVERVHAAIMLKNGSYWLQEMSMGGVTRVGRASVPIERDRRLEMGDSVELFDGARITLGEAIFEFSFGQLSQTSRSPG